MLHGVQRKLQFQKPRQWRRRPPTELRQDPNLRRTIDQYWEVARQGRDRVGLEGYVQLNCAMYLSLVPRVDDPGLPARLARDDWRLDAHGAKALDYDAFYDSLCGVADVWSPGSTDEEYAAFLDGLFARVANPAGGWLAPDEVAPAEDAVLLMLQEEAAAQGTVYEPPPPQAPPQAAPPERGAGLPAIPYAQKVHRVEDGAFLERLCAERLLAGNASEFLRAAHEQGLLSPYTSPAVPAPPAPPGPPPLRRPSSSLYPVTRLEVLAEPADKAMRRSDLRHSRELSVR
eukprot:tig00001501_g9220.t1